MNCPILEELELYSKDHTDSAKNTISYEAEYNALREEKIFRYGYSNQINTTLLTITLAVFSAGILWVTIGEENSKILDFANFFIPLFFLVPCIFAGVCFRCALRNSVRIGILSEYMRTNFEFQTKTSWEKIKQKKNINYFYDSDCKIGGVKEMPICVDDCTYYLTL